MSRSTAWRIVSILVLALFACAPSPRPETAPAVLGTPVDPAPPLAAAPEPVVVDTSPVVEPASADRPSEPSPAPRPPSQPRVRVGLATDLDEVALPCCSEGLLVRVGDREALLTEPTRVRAAVDVARRGVFRLQVAALKDEAQALELARRLDRALEEAADVVFDADIDLYRVRVGRFEERREAETLERKLAALGLSEVWLLQEGGGIERPAFVLTRGDQTRRLNGRWLEIRSRDGWVPWREGRYRGRLLLFVNDRGKLNLINDVTLEDYLRGVVPREMGPVIYDRLEALKAQTVAARTYTVRNLGEFRSEGYDICATPRCQVYGGMGVEHPLSDRAVAETQGQILTFEGRPADALYSSTCGGHTENVEVVFPLKRAPYLRGVPCLEAGVARLRPSAEGGTSPARDLMTILLPPHELGSPAAVLQDRLARLADLAGLEPPDDRLTSVERPEVKRFLASFFDLALDGRFFAAPDELATLLERPPPGWQESDRRLAGYFADVDRPRGPVLEEEEQEGMLLDLAVALDVLEEREVSYLSRHDGALVVRQAASVSTVPLGRSLITYRRSAGDYVAAELSLLAGDRLRLYLYRDALLAVIQTHPADPPELPRKAQWTRFRSAAEVRAAVSLRYPGFELQRFEVLSRGISGRVGKLRLFSTRGEEVLLEGLAVRWTLDLPDTLFTARPTQRSDSVSGWLFEGRGWGHGVGMCQVGAFGMASRGLGYREILDHYYTGLELARLRSARRHVVSGGGAR